MIIYPHPYGQTCISTQGVGLLRAEQWNAHCIAMLRSLGTPSKQSTFPHLPAYMHWESMFKQEINL